jgi:hypothetical protein
VLSIVVQDAVVTGRTVTLESKFSDLLVDVATTYPNVANPTFQCYLPIFPNKLDSTAPEADQWFVGSKFLGNRTVVFDNSIPQRDATQSPRIGFGNQSTSLSGTE